MELLPEATPTPWSFPFSPQDWAQTPPAVQAYLQTMRHELGQLPDRVDTLEARLQQHSTTSSRPPSSDAPYTKPARRTRSTPPRKAGGKPGHQGHRQALLTPTQVQAVHPTQCACGSTAFDRLIPSSTHQGLELPPITMDVTHWVFHHGRCLACGAWSKAPIGARISCKS